MFTKYIDKLETEPSQIFFLFQTNAFLLADFNPSLILNGLSILLLLVCSGLLSGSEVAYFSLAPQDKHQLKEEDSNSGKRILDLLDKPRYLLSTILIANNIINIAIVLVSNALISQLMPDDLHWLIEMSITVGLVTFLLVLFGEIAPKVYANRNSIQIARLMSSPLLVMNGIFRGLGWMLVNSTNVIEKRLAKRLKQSSISTEDIDSAIELTIKDGEFAKQDMDILKGIVRFGNTAASEIMKARLKVIAVDITSSYEDLVKIFQEESFSRVPVYEEDLDNIKGILHAKDLIELIGSPDCENWQSLIRKAIFIPKEKKIDDLFNDFQDKRTHMAIVVDEFGGTEGIVTMEDVLEEIVGEIQDEFDEEEEDNVDKVTDYIYEFDGSTPLGEITKVLQLQSDFFEAERDGAETIAGLLLILCKKIPPAGTQVSFKQHKITVLAASKRRIEKVRIIMPQANTISTTSPVS